MNVGPLDTRVTFRRLTEEQDPDYGDLKQTTEIVAPVWANKFELAPGRQESIAGLAGGGLAVARSMTRFRYRYRTDITPEMLAEVVGPAGTRVFKIIGGPSELGRHEYSEVLCEEIRK